MRMTLRLPKPDLSNGNVQRGLVVTAVVLAVVFLYFCTNFLPMFYPPRAARIAEIRGRVEKLTAEVEQAKRTAANLPRLEKEMEALHVKWEEAQTLLPPQKEIASLLRKVTVAGQQAGIEFTLFEPADPTPNTFYTEYPISVKVEGGYHQVGGFLAEVAGLTRLVNVTNLDLGALDRDGTKDEYANGDPPTVQASMMLTAYALGAEHVEAIEAQTNAATGVKAQAAKAGAQNSNAGATRGSVPNEE